MVSVIVPAYNIAPYIERCVKSILSQTYPDLEVLLVDDGSTDETPALCDQLARMDSRVRVFHKKNGGVSSARNMALDNCRGDYVSIIDGDDWIEPTLYENAVRTMQETDTDVYMFEYYIDVNGESNKHSVDKSYYGVINREMAMIHSITPHNRFAWSKVFSKKILLNSHLPGQIRFDTSIILGEDTLFMEQALLNSKGAYYSDIPYYHYDQRDGSATRSSFKEKKLSGLESYQRVYKMMQENGLVEAEFYAKEALLNLGIQLGRYVAESDKETQKRAFLVIGEYIKPVLKDVLYDKRAAKASKMKAFMAMISIPMTSKLLNLKK